ncbi:MAG: hypothetical protein B6D56_05535 [Candidatus Omnitrophica bacterium 4484_70.1]|nr:MAG: hypothetical protein B6D56_05535 [Candidatus Omnitrophica bacterium 4484_70.1]
MTFFLIKISSFIGAPPCFWGSLSPFFWLKYYKTRSALFIDFYFLISLFIIDLQKIRPIFGETPNFLIVFILISLHIKISDASLEKMEKVNILAP